MEPTKVAVITGGASGIGWATSVRLVADGWLVVIADVDAALGSSRARDGGDRVVFEEMDVCDRDGVSAAMARVVDAHGRIDLLVNNAGVQAHDNLESLSWESWTHVIDVDLHGAFNCLQSAGRIMLDAGSGAVVNIVSISAARGAGGRAPYCVAKAGLVSLTQVAAVEWASRGVRVNAVGPGYIDTPLYRKAVDDGRLHEADILKRIPMDRLGTHAEIASTVAFLASPEAAYVTGQVIYVDGGFLADYGVPVVGTHAWGSDAHAGPEGAEVRSDG